MSEVNEKRINQQAEVSEELQLLREMRKYTEKYSEEYIKKNFMRLEAYSSTEMGSTPEEQMWVYTKCSELLMHCAIAEFYRKVLAIATKMHRKEKGSEEEFMRKHRDQIAEIKRKLYRKYQADVVAEKQRWQEKNSA